MKQLFSEKENMCTSLFMVHQPGKLIIFAVLVSPQSSSRGCPAVAWDRDRTALPSGVLCSRMSETDTKCFTDNGGTVQG